MQIQTKRSDLFMSCNLRLSGVKFQKSRKVGLVGQIIRQNEAEEKKTRLYNWKLSVNMKIRPIKNHSYNYCPHRI